jgi:hypothetical protein
MEGWIQAQILCASLRIRKPWSRLKVPDLFRGFRGANVFRFGKGAENVP